MPLIAHDIPLVTGSFLVHYWFTGWKKWKAVIRWRDSFLYLGRYDSAEAVGVASDDWTAEAIGKSTTISVLQLL